MFGNYKSNTRLLFGSLLLLLVVSCTHQNKKLAHNIDEFNDLVAQLKPGDTLVMANGQWHDVQLHFHADGTEQKPIVLKAEESGKVTIEGASNLAISGNFAVVSGLVFVNGHTPGGPVIALKYGNTLAHNSRVTNVAIDHYNPSNRSVRDTWVEVHGQNNRLDHCYFGGKLNIGETVRVKLNREKSLNNNHRIDHNYFGYRPRLGSNGGETLRVGTSTHSLKPSRTIIENNYFEECNGEVEHVSIKAGNNIIRGNTFYQCEGVLALRHGNENVVENNFFLGGFKPHTGGVRIINKKQIIRNNHFQELTGSRFFGVLPVMNGVPNSLINRYHNAEDVQVTGNRFFYCNNIELGVGTDNERTEAPENIAFTGNLFYNSNQAHVYKALDDISTFTFADNTVKTSQPSFAHKGFVSEKNSYKKEGAFQLYASGDYLPELTATPDNCGPKWYDKIPRYYKRDLQEKTISVDEHNDLQDAIAEAQPGDTIVLLQRELTFTEPIIIDKPLAIVGNDDRNLVQLRFEANDAHHPFFILANGGGLLIRNLLFDGASSTAVSAAAVTTTDEPTISHYNFTAINCGFKHFNASRYGAFKAYKSTFADSITFETCFFSDISGDAINLAGELEDRGRYNAEHVILRNCLFKGVMGAALNLRRGGNDESTLGPFLEVNHCSFIDVNNKELGSVLLLIGVQRCEIKNSLFIEAGKSGRAIKMEDPGWVETTVHHTALLNAGRIESFYNRLGDQVIIRKKNDLVSGLLGDDARPLGCSSTVRTIFTTNQ